MTGVPFEPQPRTEIQLEDPILSSYVVVMAAKIPTPIGQVPALVFRFELPGGAGFLDPVVLPLDNPGKGDELVELIRAAVATALS